MPYVTLAELRESQNLADASRFSDTKLTAAIAWFEEMFEDFTGVAWVERSRTALRVSGSGRATLLLPDLYPRAVSAITVYPTTGAGVAFTAAELADLILTDWGEVSRLSLGVWTLGIRNIAVTYTYGKTTAPPADVKEAALVAIEDHVMPGNLTNRQFSVATEAGIARSSTPGEERPFGLPFVDEVALRRREYVPAVA